MRGVIGVQCLVSEVATERSVMALSTPGAPARELEHRADPQTPDLDGTRGSTAPGMYCLRGPDYSLSLPKISFCRLHLSRSWLRSSLGTLCSHGIGPIMRGAADSEALGKWTATEMQHTQQLVYQANFTCQDIIILEIIPPDRTVWNYVHNKRTENQ